MYHTLALAGQVGHSRVHDHLSALSTLFCRYMGKLDHNSKRMAERDRRAFLAVAGCLAVDAPAEVRQLDREIVPGQKIADHLYQIRQHPGGEWRIELVESLARWNSREETAILERAIALSLVPRFRKRSIRASIILMTETDVPAKLPSIFYRNRGALSCKLRVRYRKIWKTAARWLFGMNRLPVLTLVPLSRHSRRDMERAIDLLRNEGDEDLISQFLTHARVRYSEEEVARFAAMFEKQTLEILAGTKAGKKLRRDALKEGREKGIEKGIEKGVEKGFGQGRLSAIHDAIRSLIKDRFPALAGTRAVDRITDHSRAQRVFAQLLSAKSEAEARAALR